MPVTRTVYFGVIDADATNGHIVANGGSMMVPPTTNPAFYTAVFGLIPRRLPVNGLEHYTLHDGEPAVPPRCGCRASPWIYSAPRTGR